jgi:hypothetical protein
VEIGTSQADASGVQVGQVGFFALANTLGKQIAAILASTTGTTATNRGGDLAFFTKPNGGALAQTMVLDKDGNLGVGTTAPTAKLHVGGTAGTDGIKYPDGSLQTRAPGIVYTRWGRTTCPSGATLLYAGYAAGGHYGHVGSGANTVCLNSVPTWGQYNDGDQNGALLYGVEYENQGAVGALAGLHDYDLRCSVCYRQDTTISFWNWGSQTCPSGWTPEYTGYIVANHYTQYKSEFVCMDGASEATGSNANSNGSLWYTTEYECGSLPCPPFVQNREATCSLCRR